MTYQKTIWENDGEPSIDATNLNKIEQGIYDAQYPTGGTSGQVLMKTDNGVAWDDLPETVLWGNVLGQLSEQTDLYSELSAKLNTPNGGATGQYLQKTASGTQWSTVETGGAKIEKNVTLSASSWSTDSYTITDSDIGANSTVFLTYPSTMSDSDFTTLKSAGIRGTAQTTGSITLKATGDVPESDLVITLIIWG